MIPNDHPLGLVWYHSHAHGVGEYGMMSGLFGAMIIEDTANDVTVIPTECHQSHDVRTK
jgi:FtsP/CotA-like multicopper oxidase with cupredoxin domain